MLLLAFVAFVVLQIVCFPLLIVGILLVTYKQMVVSKRLGVSGTAIEVINGRWTMHIFGMRPDSAAARLAGVLPNTSLLGLWLVLFPLWVKYKLSGTLFLYPRVPKEGSETLADFVIARTHYFDRIIERVTADVDQFVVLGAGYDTRCYSELMRNGIRCFEVDQAVTQQLKTASLERAGVGAAHVTFVEVDFNRDDLFEKLQARGYDTTKRTLFLWEGVTLYLSEETVRKTLRDVRACASTGSVVLADIYADRMINSMKAAAKYIGEPVDFSLSLATDCDGDLSGFLGSEGLAIGETYFLGKTHDKGPYGVVVEMRT